MAAAAATAVATKKPLVAVHSPSSPFAELLRRSRFASFDPAIRQTYSSPPANAHRGDWGLKRPIALRRKNAFISLKSFEHHAHFTEWNHAENQVRFVRRVEEMGAKPQTVPMTPWHKGLGKARTQWLLDSDFCPEGVQDTRKLLHKENSQKTVNLNELGKQGSGAYGAKRASPIQQEKDAIDVQLAPNINAMTRHEFVRYLRHLRSLRPAFKDWIEANRDKPRIVDKSLFSLAQNAEAGLHRRFLQEHSASQFQKVDYHKLEHNPHPTAALTYTHPSPLETAYFAKPQPGFVLNPISSKMTGSTARDRAYAASFGGLTATLHYKNAGSKIPLLDANSDTGIDRSRIQDSIANMRLVKNKGLLLQQPPRVVGREAQGLKGVLIDATVTTTGSPTGSGLGGDNPYPLGSAQYVGADPVGSKSTPRGFGSVSTYKKTPNYYNLGPMTTSLDDNANGLIDTLKAMVPTAKKGRADEGANDEGL